MGEEIKTTKVGLGDSQEGSAACISFSLLPALKLSLVATDKAIGKSSRLTAHCADARC
jgi:hypothetical protein